MNRGIALGVLVLATAGLAGCGKSDTANSSAAVSPPDAINALKGLDADIVPATPTAEQPVTGITLNGDKVTDDAMGQVARFPKLKTLALKNTAVTAAGLAKLGSLVTLERLDLSGSKKIDDNAIAQIAHLAGMQVLKLNDTAAGDGAMASVARLSGLQTLELANTAVGDAGLAKLTPLVLLDELRLDGTKVTDAGLEHLKQLPALKTVYVAGTAVTLAGAEKLKTETKKTNPELRVIQ
jgi:hypothetical protein